MVGRAAGHDVHRVQILNEFFLNAQTRQVNGPVFYHGMDGVLHRPGLLMNLLHHEVLVAALFGGFGVPLDFRQGLFNDITVQVEEGHVSAGQPGHFHIADIIHISGIL